MPTAGNNNTLKVNNSSLYLTQHLRALHSNHFQIQKTFSFGGTEFHVIKKMPIPSKNMPSTDSPVHSFIICCYCVAKNSLIPPPPSAGRYELPCLGLDECLGVCQLHQRDTEKNGKCTSFAVCKYFFLHNIIITRVLLVVGIRASFFDSSNT